MQEESRIAAQEAAKIRYETIERLLNAPLDGFSRVKPGKHVPHSKNQGFVGRKHELKELRTYPVQAPKNAARLSPAANAHPNAFLSDARAVVVHGLGGQGKSELALHFAYDTFANFESILWVAAETPQKNQISFSEAARTLSMPSTRSNSTADATKVSGDALNGSEQRSLHGW
jgi:hypothetical protein